VTGPSEDPLERLRARLAQLDDLPVAEHAAVLEEVHDGLVAELEALTLGPRPA
jgi:hypothetical protein